MLNAKKIILILVLTSWFLIPGQAQTSAFSIGVHGGGQAWIPTAAPGINGEIQPGFGGTGTLEVRYSFYGCFTDRLGMGFTLGGGIGYGSSGIKGKVTDNFTNTDYLGNQIDYTTSASFAQTERWAKGEVSLMLAFCFGNVIVNVGPRLMMPFSINSSLTVNEASIDAYYPRYNVHVENKQITGLLNTPYTQLSRSRLPQYNILMGAEIGYEWYFTNTSCLGFQLFADIGVWNSPSPITGNPSPLIQVSPITDAANPVPEVTVNSPEPLVASRRYLDFGVRLYYAFSPVSANTHRKHASPSRDTRKHHNRYYWQD